MLPSENIISTVVLDFTIRMFLEIREIREIFYLIIFIFETIPNKSIIHHFFYQYLSRIDFFFPFS